MSLATPALQCVRVVDPVIDLPAQRIYGVLDAGAETSYVPYQCSSLGPSTAQVTCNPPDSSSIVHPIIYAECKYSTVFNVTGQTPGQSVLSIGQLAGLRAWPFSSTVTNMQVTLNGKGLSTNLNAYLHPFLHCNSFKMQQDHELSTVPSMLDQWQEYAQGLGQNNNPLAVYGTNSAQISRGAFIKTTDITNGVVQANGTGTSTVVFTTYEPLLISPFAESKKGFVGLSTMSVNFAFGDLKRIWAISSASPVVIANTSSAVAVTMTALTLHFRYVKPKSLSSIPPVVSYVYSSVLHTNSNSQTVSALAQDQQISLNCGNLQSIPRRLVIYVREALANQTLYTSDIFQEIKQITLSWGNRQGLLSQCTSRDLYQISRTNGLDLSYPQWSQSVGSILLIDIGKDVCLDSASAPGLLDSPLLSMVVTFNSLNSTRALACELCCDIIGEGTLSIGPNGAINYGTAPLTRQNVIDSQLSSEMRMYEQPTNMYGGSFLDSIRNFGRSAYTSLKPYFKPLEAIGSTFLGLGHGGSSSTGGCQDEEQDETMVLEEQVPVPKKGSGKRKEMEVEVESRPSIFPVLSNKRPRGGQLISRDQLSRNL